ncbi:MAG: hypothetical protein ACYCPT_14035, partial [Acidimicrobiales bacterium]
MALNNILDTIDPQIVISYISYEPSTTDKLSYIFNKSYSCSRKLIHLFPKTNEFILILTTIFSNINKKALLYYTKFILNNGYDHDEYVNIFIIALLKWIHNKCFQYQYITLLLKYGVDFNDIRCTILRDLLQKISHKTLILLLTHNLDATKIHETVCVCPIINHKYSI